ncbi:hypothetical protein DVR12_14470 [Chitinophaga silvatica]|uniref:CMP/dCMP-type deaminase domain-containing protein n=1 Tax=Chitinophaga silvatica TaxID=2282649 RepID=A0A3E1Y9I2_9BACT|nr:deaminase [Chitinophaga silvatica]RFS21856.1 hypothetical protein DVR12_14470 [Chitinophaga silvatica]
MVIPIIEKDAIVFLGLLAIGYKNFDTQFIHKDGKPTHSNGLNIFAAIIDNCDGEVIGQKQNHIHAECNPMLHAEQLTLKEAIQRINIKRPRNSDEQSVESYYRDMLFNQPNKTEKIPMGATIYTTLEPCPFCTSALLVTRMSRIVYIIPDTTYGQSFSFLKDKYYSSYNITYENLKIPTYSESKLISNCGAKLKWLLDYVNSYTQIATLYLDDLKEFLQECNAQFLQLTAADLLTEGEDRQNNLNTLLGLQDRLKELYA